MPCITIGLYYLLFTPTLPCQYNCPCQRLHRRAGRIASVVFFEDALAELAKVLRGGQLLVDIRLHEESERFTRDALGVDVRRSPDPHAVRRGPQTARSRELESLAGLECKAVGGDGDLREGTAACANVEARAGRGRLHDHWVARGRAMKVHGLWSDVRYQNNEVEQ